MQVSTIGLAESKFSSGVLLPQVFPGAVAQKAGLHEGDTITQLNGRFLKPSMTAVNDLVEYIKYVQTAASLPHMLLPGLVVYLLTVITLSAATSTC